MLVDKIKYYIKDSNRLYLRLFGKWLSDEEYLKRYFEDVMGYPLDLNQPKTFNEKLQWLKLHDRKPVYSKMVDKYEAKEWVRNILGEQYLIPTIGLWDNFEAIDFSLLPNQFVLKCTHDSGGLTICRDKKVFSIKNAKKKIKRCLKKNYYWQGREWPYKEVKPQIIAEKYMEQNEGNSLIDYKFFCFNGIPEFLYVSKGLENHATAQIGFYDMAGTEMYFYRSDYRPYHDAVMPSNFEDMKSIAKILANEVQSAFVRIDLYSIDGRIYFSEITFSPCSGMIPFEPASADKELGKLLEIPLGE